MELLVEAPERGKGAIEHGDLSSQAQGHGGGLGACHATAKNDHLASHDARYAAEQNAAAALGFLQACRADLDGHAAGDFAHGGQEGQGAFRTGYRFIGDGGDATGLERFRLGWVGGEVQVGKKGLPRTKADNFVQLRLLDLDDQFGLVKHLVRRAQRGPSGGVGAIVAADADPRTPFNQDAMAVLGEFCHGL